MSGKRRFDSVDRINLDNRIITLAEEVLRIPFDSAVVKSNPVYLLLSFHLSLAVEFYIAS